jgi:hypothetical protein
VKPADNMIQIHAARGLIAARAARRLFSSGASEHNGAAGGDSYWRRWRPRHLGESEVLRRGLALLLAAAVLSGGYGVYASFRRAHERAHIVETAVGGAKFAVLSSFLRPSSRQGGATSALQAALLFPGFTAAGDFDDVTAKTDLDRRLAETVSLVIRKPDPRLDPADRTARLYERFLDENSWSHPGGLIARAFADDSPFRGDELYFTAPEGREFAARCRKPDPSAATPNTCQADMRVDDVDVEIRFSAALLSEWERLRNGARSFVAAARR